MSEALLGLAENNPLEGLSAEELDNLSQSNKKAKMVDASQSSLETVVLETPMEGTSEGRGVVHEQKKSLFPTATEMAFNRKLVSYKDVILGVSDEDKDESSGPEDDSSESSSEDEVMESDEEDGERGKDKGDPFCPIIHISREEFKEACKPWKYSIIVKVLGKKMIVQKQNRKRQIPTRKETAGTSKSVGGTNLEIRNQVQKGGLRFSALVEEEIEHVEVSHVVGDKEQRGPTTVIHLKDKARKGTQSLGPRTFQPNESRPKGDEHIVSCGAKVLEQGEPKSMDLDGANSSAQQTFGTETNRDNTNNQISLIEGKLVVSNRRPPDERAQGDTNQVMFEVGAECMASDPIPLNMHFASVRDMATARGDWDVEKFKNLIPNEVLNEVLGIVPPIVDSGEDTIAWSLTNNGKFSTKSAYNLEAY
ncbi:hypothetical protein SESBI_49285 [Sesbania bispinosa]|nr:hypothetical protein SESBI_49285 [Sesbania bispinosa]